MGWKSLQEALAIEAGSPGRKFVLSLLAWRACDSCGLAWPGVRWLCDNTEMAERSVQTALADLARAGHVEARSYTTGGRGRATEYVVLPQRAELSTAPCGECAARRRNPANAAGYLRRKGNTPQEVRGIEGQGDAIPRKNCTENPAGFAPHQLENQDQLAAESSLPLGPTSGPTHRAASKPSGPSHVRESLQSLGIFAPEPEAENRP